MILARIGSVVAMLASLQCPAAGPGTPVAPTTVLLDQWIAPAPRTFASPERGQAGIAWRSASYAEMSSGVLREQSLLSADLFRPRLSMRSYAVPSDVNLVAELGGLFEVKRLKGHDAAALWWAARVCPKCAWDFKNATGLTRLDQRTLEPFGNTWFGLSGRAVGLAPKFLDAGAGVASVVSHGLEFGISWQFLGDDPRDWHASHEGMNDFDSGAWRDLLPDLLPALGGMTDADRRWFGIFGAAEYVAMLEHMRAESNAATGFPPAMEAVNRSLQRSRERAAAASRPPAKGAKDPGMRKDRESHAAAAERSRISREDLLFDRDNRHRVRTPSPRTDKVTATLAPRDPVRISAPPRLDPADTAKPIEIWLR